MTSEQSVSIPCHGSTISLNDRGITVTQHRMSAPFTGAEFFMDYGELLGWRYQEPHSASLGWIQLLTPRTDLSIHRCAVVAENMVRFAPSQIHLFRLFHNFLIQIQSGELSPADAQNSLQSLLQDQDGEEKIAQASTASSVSSSENKASGKKKKSQWKAVSTPDEIPEPNKNADIDHPLFGKNVTITGDFSPYEKGDMWAMIADHGGLVGKNVTKKTQIVVIGQWDSMTSKEKRARELQDKGQDIQLWSTEEFLSAVGKGSS